MTDAEKLTKVIEKADKNGFGFWRWLTENYMVSLTNHDWKSKAIYDLIKMGYKLLLIDHEFAKAFWGEERDVLNDVVRLGQNPIAWKHHSQQAVISDNMLDYYYERL